MRNYLLPLQNNKNNITWQKNLKVIFSQVIFQNTSETSALPYFDQTMNETFLKRCWL